MSEAARTAGAEGQGEPLPGGAARPGAVPLPQKFAPSPRQLTAYPHRTRGSGTTTPSPPRSRLPSLLLHFRNSSGHPIHGSVFRRAPLSPNLGRTAARSARRGTPSWSLRKGEGDHPSRTEAPARPRQVPGDSERPAPHPDPETFAPLRGKLSVAAPPTPGRPFPRRADPLSPRLPAPPGRVSARSRGTPAVCGAAAANTYPESFPIFTKLNTSIHAAG